MRSLDQQTRTAKGFCVRSTYLPLTFSRLMWVSDTSRAAGTQKQQGQFNTDRLTDFQCQAWFCLHGLKLSCSQTVMYSYFSSAYFSYFIFPQEHNAKNTLI